MENHHRHTPSTAIGFCLLPSELIEKILFKLSLPEIFQLKPLNKSIAAIISDSDFIHQYNSQTPSMTWLFVYKKRWHRDISLHCFTDRRSGRWFKIEISLLLRPVISPCGGDSLYLLMASGNVFLFASNTNQEVIAVNLVTKTVKKIPPSPLGPCGTSSWRRSGMKLVSKSGHFRFMFAELVEARPVLFVYDFETNKWHSMEAREDFDEISRFDQRDSNYVLLNIANGTYDNMVIAIGLESGGSPILLRPRFDGGQNDGQRLTVGFSWGNVFDRLHVYGDGHMLIVKSNGVDDASTGARVIDGIDLWGLGRNGRQWEYISNVPINIMEKMKKCYSVIMGCLERKEGVIRIVLMSNFEGLWNIIWLSYDIERSQWGWVSVPDCKMRGLNMAGVAFSSGLTLS